MWTWDGTIWSIQATALGVASISAAEIQTGAVTADKIANTAITAEKIANGAVMASKLGNDISLTPADNSIGQSKLAQDLSGITICTSTTRPASPFTGQAIYETDTKKMRFYIGIDGWSTGTQHNTALPVEVLMVGGGGGAGSYSGGGGGGEVITFSRTLVPGTYTAVIGSGGSGTTSQSWADSRHGFATTFLGETAKPGGGGKSSDDRNATTPVSSGIPPDNGVDTRVANGGGGSSRSAGYFGTLGTSVGAGVTRYGAKRGGQESTGSTNEQPNYPGGGGGGAGASVTGNSGSTNASAGGVGVSIDILGTPYFWGGGGGGGTYYSGTGANGGNGGGGAGSGGGGGGTGGSGYNNGGNGSTGAGGAGGLNTGGGGGGGRGETNSSGGNGGSGIVIIRYETSVGAGFSISGGTVSSYGGFTLRTFTSTQPLVIS